MSSLRKCCLAGLLAICQTGCGGAKDPVPPLGKISGTVLIDGKPPGGECEVNFFDASKGAGTLAVVDATGAFALGGPIPAGSYKVYVTSKEPEPTQPGVPRPKRITNIPPKYQSADTTDIIADVKEGENAPLALDLKKK
jgi:hypothetical protein